MIVSPFKYSGRKLKYVNQINSLYKNLFFSLNTNNLIYVEPYAGSASIFFNLTSEFSSYIISDIDRNVIRIHKSLKDASYDDYVSIINEVSEKWGNIKDDKIAYYNFRNWFNLNIWNSDDIKEGLYLQLLFSSCINSMARFGKNGFNQGWGNRLYIIGEYEYKHIHKVLQRALIYNYSFEDLNKNILYKENEESLFYFLDPPYINRATSYRTLEYEEYQKFIDFLNNTKSKWIYTDIEENQIKFPYIVLREEMNNTSPLSKKEKLQNKEVAFYNF